jgi:hypothetical protein
VTDVVEDTTNIANDTVHTVVDGVIDVVNAGGNPIGGLLGG